MNLQSLLYFKTVAETEHFTKAATSLFITQSALSKAIRNLETELGVSLFFKDGRNVSLTRYGQVFYQYIKRSTDEIERGIEVIRKMADEERNVITISALYSMYAEFLPDKISEFRQLYSDATFSLEYKRTSQILKDILDNKSDICICSNFDDQQPQYALINRHLLREEELIIIAPKNHPLSAKKTVNIKDLSREKFVIYKRTGVGINHVFNTMCHNAGFEPNIVAEGYTDYGVFGLVSAGKGIAVISSYTHMSVNNVSVIKFGEGHIPTRSLFVIWRKDHILPPYAERFKNFLIEDR